MTNTRLEWKFKNQLINTIVATGGMVFGGAARDKYLHDSHATAFYSKGTVYKDVYCDPSVMPHLSGRFLTPNDIDAYINKESHAKLLTALKKVCPSINEVFKKDLHTYFPDTMVAAGRITHYRYSVQMMAISSPMLGCLIHEIGSVVGQRRGRDWLHILNEASSQSYIDLMVAVTGSVYKAIDPPFGPVDFACNSLLLDRLGFRLSRHYATAGNDPVNHTKSFMQVLGQIDNKQAVLANLRWYRVDKMEAKGWLIIGLYNEVERVKIEYSGHCIICHSNVPHDHFKLKCCDARYHPQCLHQAIVEGATSMKTRNECIMCSTALNKIQEDADRLEDYMADRGIPLRSTAEGDPVLPPLDDLYA